MMDTLTTNDYVMKSDQNRSPQHCFLRPCRPKYKDVLQSLPVTFDVEILPKIGILKKQL